MSFETTFTVEAKKRLAEQRDKAKDLILGGRPAEFSEYRYSMGYIKAMEDAEKILDQVLEDIQKA